MIPRLDSRLEQSLDVPTFLDRLVEAGFAGDIEASAGTRSVYATDNSIYELAPKGVIFPAGVADLKIIATVLCEPAFRHVSIAPRGGGTGTNGQSLTSGIVVDCSRHMNRVLEIDPVRRTVRVEAGVVKDQLNRALKDHGLFFAPELSTSNRATIGGMISTDACGQGSCLYGKTSNHVLGLRIVLSDGTDWWSVPLDADALDAVKARADRVGEIYRTSESVVTENRAKIAEIFPSLNRYMTGYDLAHVIAPDGRFDLNALICGSEGTLAFVAEAELNVLPIPRHAALVNIGYGDFNAALEDARALVALKVASVETIDEKVLSLARRDVGWSSISRFFHDDGRGTANGINIVEVLADSPAELSRKIDEVTALLDAAGQDRRRGHTVTADKAEIDAIWSMRKRAVGLLGNLDGPARPVAFVEDTAVPPENLAAYIKEFRALLDAEGLAYGMFGHVDAGVLHVRPALDLTTDADVQRVRRITDAVVALTRKYGGVLWGEHGKGVRSEYVPAYFGELYPSLQAIKAAFDPDNRFNPGKIAAPGAEGLLKIDEVPLRGPTDRAIGAQTRAAFDNATHCNGNGACFDFDESNPMCPSYKATGDRRYSPKGRASLMRQWLRLLAEKGIDPRAEAASLRRGNRIAGIPARLVNTLNPRNRDDFSHEVREAMDTCLSCKACTSQCPVKVSVPAFRSKFLELYYGRYLRPVKDPLVSAIETLLPLMARMRPLYNLVAGTALGQRLMKVVGLTALPVLPRNSLRAGIAHLGIGTVDSDVLATLPAEERQRIVVFVPDAFTANFDPDVVLAAVRLAQAMGLTPLLAPPNINGKALHVHGYLGRFEKAASRTGSSLQKIADLGVTLVGLDPSMTLTLRSEYREIHGSPLKATVLLPQEWLAANLDRLPPVRDGSAERRAIVLPHCTEQSNVPGSFEQWRAVFERVGIVLESARVGCCGMAGTFGHEVRNQPISLKLYAKSWAPAVARRSTTPIVMATGYSCRSQVSRVDRLSIPHPLQVLVREIGGPRLNGI